MCEDYRYTDRNNNCKYYFNCFIYTVANKDKIWENAQSVVERS